MLKIPWDSFFLNHLAISYLVSSEVLQILIIWCRKCIYLFWNNWLHFKVIRARHLLYNFKHITSKKHKPYSKPSNDKNKHRIHHKRIIMPLKYYKLSKSVLFPIIFGRSVQIFWEDSNFVWVILNGLYFQWFLIEMNEGYTMSYTKPKKHQTHQKPQTS